METSIIEKISALYGTALSNIFYHINTVLVETIEVFLPYILTLYFIFVGYQYLLGNINQSQINKIRLLIVLPILISIFFNYTMYLNLIVLPILLVKDYLVTAISSIATTTSDGNTFLIIDTIFLNILTFIKSQLMDSFLSSPFDFIMGVLILFIYGSLYIWIGFFMIKSFIATAFFLMIGVIPLICFAFDSTQHIFYAWLKAVVTYFLYAPISAFFIIFVYWISIGTSSNLNKEIDSILLLIISGSLMVLFVKDIPEYANAITSAMSSGQSTAGSVIKWGSVQADKNVLK